MPGSWNSWGWFVKDKISSLSPKDFLVSLKYLCDIISYFWWVAKGFLLG